MDPPFSAESEECTPVKLAHLVELRSTLAATYVRRAARLPHWTNASPAAGQVLRVDKRDSLGGPLAKHIAGVGRPKSANPREGLTPVHTQAFEAEAETARFRQQLNLAAPTLGQSAEGPAVHVVVRGAGLAAGGVVAPKGGRRQTDPARSTQATTDAGKRGEGFQP